MLQQLTIAGRSPQTIRNYCSYLAKIALHYHEVPIRLSTEQIHQYLYIARSQYNSPSETFFKLTVYSLRFAFRRVGHKDRLIELPKIARVKTLPVVLNQDEVIRVFNACTNPKHRLILEVLYGCGLRNSELRNLRTSDVDLQRQMLHVRNGKGRKDRYVPIGNILAQNLGCYLQNSPQGHYLFSGNLKGEKVLGQYSVKGLQWVVSQASKKAGILKKVTVHTFRHTYATHLLDLGLDILTIREMLGHSDIQNTLIYLHIAKSRKMNAFSPLDFLQKPMDIANPTFRCPLASCM